MLGLTLDPVRFNAGSSHFEWRQNVSQLDRVASLMKERDEQCLLLEGRADSKTDPRPGQQLSLARARSIQQYLLGVGVSAARLAVRGLASTCERQPGDSRNHQVTLRVLRCPLPSPLPDPDCNNERGWFPYGPGQHDTSSP